MYEELFSGLHEDPSRHLTVTFEAQHDEMVMVRDIPSPRCASTPGPVHRSGARGLHPGDDGRVRGSPSSRAWWTASRGACRSRAHDTQVADAIDEVLSPRGVLVVIEASTCACPCAGEEARLGHGHVVGAWPLPQ